MIISPAPLGVMAVEPSLFTIWVLAAGFGALGFWSGRRWIWPGIVVLAWILISLRGAHEALTDPVSRPAILREEGMRYVTESYLAHAISIAATVVGLAWGVGRWWRRRDASRE
ncbi:MAG: hypothetical protein KY467_17275 [Gemmatimonadetes bacterium]|nr:hypothetical protein [Gemmatimonadota bacterium]